MPALPPLALACFFLFCQCAFATPVTTLAPNKPWIDDAPAKTDPKDPYADEVDALVALLNPGEQSGENMDMPQLFAVIRHPPKNENDGKPERRDLLADLEEIKYLDKKAWGANVSVKKPGVYQLILESKPWWDEKEDVFRQDLAKVILPVRSHDPVWNLPAGQLLEIIPLTRPYGLKAPALFTGKILMDGKPGDNVVARMGRIGVANGGEDWRDIQETRSNAAGQFSFLLTNPGWHFVQATIVADPLKGPDGSPKPLIYGSVLWLYVDPANAPKAKR